jgi:hypothetical protein
MVILRLSGKTVIAEPQCDGMTGAISCNTRSSMHSPRPTPRWQRRLADFFIPTLIGDNIAAENRWPGTCPQNSLDE